MRVWGGSLATITVIPVFYFIFWQAASKQTTNDLHFPSDLLFNEFHVSKFTTSHEVTVFSGL